LSSPFTISTEPTHHKIETDEGDLEVWIKPLSWVEQQEALTKFVEFTFEDEDVTPTLDFGGYWKFILKNCVVKTMPKLTYSDLLNLKPEVGSKLGKVLPSLNEIMESLGESAANPLE
tara:strand:- start:307 stop:657 length:351 start_codon:yes stop_codon:yes gene_type:complete